MIANCQQKDNKRNRKMQYKLQQMLVNQNAQ